MICMFGMGNSVGMMHCAQRESPIYMPSTAASSLHMDCSEETARAIDEEVIALIQTSYDQAKRLLADHTTELERVTTKLLEVETLDEEAFQQLLDTRES
jgi:cell division protease FtsH